MRASTLVFLLSIVTTGPASPAIPDSGRLTVRSDLSGIPLYFDGDFIGTTPLTLATVKAGEYSLVPASSDSLENLYWRLRHASLGEKLTVLWTLGRIDAATARVLVRPGAISSITISRKEIEAGACRAKWLVFGSAGGLFLVGVLSGVLLHSLAD